MSNLKDEIREKDAKFQKELTVLDRDNWELRRKLEKMNDAHIEELEDLKSKHSMTLGPLTHKCNSSTLNAVLKIAKPPFRIPPRNPQ